MGSKGMGKTTALNGGLSFPLSKVIINAEAFKDTENKELKEFLEYLKTGKTKSEFTRRIEEMIQTVKQNEQARQEYRLMSTFEMDARYKGFTEGLKQKSIETAQLMKMEKCDNNFIMRITGLPEEEIEKLQIRGGKKLFRIKVSFLPYDPSYLQKNRLGAPPLRTPRLYKGEDNLTARGKCKIGSFEPVIHKDKIALINLYD